MLERKIIVRISFFLEDKDKLSYRTTCKTIMETMRCNPGICYTPTQFLIRVSGFYLNQNSFHNGWNYYQNVIQSANEFPAVLHKLRDPNVKNRLVEIVKQCNTPKLFSGEDGRLYFPGVKNGMHTWSLNYAWMMANIDIGRSFILLSDISDSHMWREFSTDQVSAFAKEIGMALEADYTLKFTDKRELILVPPDTQKKAYLVLDKNTTISFFKELQNTKKRLLLANSIENMIHSAEELQMMINMAQSSEELLECFNKDSINDFAESCVTDLFRVLNSYPELLSEAVQKIQCASFLSGCFNNMFQVILDETDPRKKISLLNYFLITTLSQKLYSILQNSLNQFDMMNPELSVSLSIPDRNEIYSDKCEIVPGVDIPEMGKDNPGFEFR